MNKTSILSFHSSLEVALMIYLFGWVGGWVGWGDGLTVIIMLISVQVHLHLTLIIVILAVAVTFHYRGTQVMKSPWAIKRTSAKPAVILKIFSTF